MSLGPFSKQRQLVATDGQSALIQRRCMQLDAVKRIHYPFLLIAILEV